MDAALEHADEDRQDPELRGRHEEERGEEHDAHVGHDRRHDHRLAAKPPGHPPVQDRAWERHELRDQQRHHQLSRVDAQLGAVRGAHRDHRVHRIDVEEEREHEHPQRLVPHYLAEGAAKLAEGAAHGRSQLVACGAVMLLTVAGDQRDRERDPPDGGDDERCAGAAGRRPAEWQRRAAEDQRDAHDERHGRADVAPAVAVRGDLVHAFVRRGVDQHRIVERERAVESDRREDIHDQERQPRQWKRHRAARDDAGAEEAEEELDFHALHVGNRAEQRHEQRDDQRCDGLRVAPGRHDVAVRGHQRFRVDRNHRGGQQHERGVAHVVDDPFLLARGEFRGGGEGRICAGRCTVCRAIGGFGCDAVVHGDS